MLRIFYEVQFLFTSGLSAKDLKKGFFGKPNPYARMCIVPRFRGLAVIQKYHGQQAKTIAKNSTVNPAWKNEVFSLNAVILFMHNANSYLHIFVQIQTPFT